MRGLLHVGKHEDQYNYNVIISIPILTTADMKHATKTTAVARTARHTVLVYLMLRHDNQTR